MIGTLRKVVIPRVSRLLLKSFSKATDSCFITTPIYYVNGDPHLGHAYTSVLTDIIARFHRLNGKNVIFLTGTDEHGQKVEQSAKSVQSTTVMDYCTNVSNKFKDLGRNLNVSNDDFIRTTDARQSKAVKAIWKRLESNGHIYLDSYQGWYSIRDECFYSDTELVDGKAPTGANVDWVKEENYFFRLSSFSDRLLQYYESNPTFIAPTSSRNEVISFIKKEGGLKDLSISRTTFSWGIPVPGDEGHVVYVWLDALTNYIAALGYPDVDTEKFKMFWPAALHVVGKDILRFHAIFWPAFLMAAELDLPQRVFAHGWWTRDGQKMSKSVGNVIAPQELIDRYGADYVRYFLAAEIRFGSDGDFSHDLFALRINTDLANNIGNLMHRVLTMVDKHCDGEIPAPSVHLKSDDTKLLESVKSTLTAIQMHFEQQEIKEICEAIVAIGHLGNKYFDTETPWKLAKSAESEDKVRLQTVLYILSELLRCTAIYLTPFIPHTSACMLDQLGVPCDMRSYASLSALVQPGLKIIKPTPLFPRIELQPQEMTKINMKKAVETVDPLWRQYDSLDDQQLGVKVREVGDRIRRMKLETIKSNKTKADLKSSIGELNYLKSRLSKG